MNPRRAVYNAVLCGRDPFACGLPAPVVSWHLIWLHHRGLVDVQLDGIRPGARAAA